MRRSAHYGLAVCSVGLVVCLKLYFHELLGEGVPFLLFFSPILLTAIYGGRGPALLATVLSAAATNYFFIPPYFEFSLTVRDAIHMAVLLMEGVVIAEVSARRIASASEGRLQRDLLRTTLLSIGDAVVVTNAAGLVTLMNPLAESLLGYGTEEAEGKSLKTVFRLAKQGNREMAPNAVGSLANHSILLARDGKEIPIEDTTAPIRTPTGALAGAVLVFRDISKRRKAERDVRESERRLSSVLENISDGFAILDREWLYVFLNEQAAKIRGRSRDELLGTMVWREEQDAPSLQSYQNFERAVRENVSVHFEEYLSSSGRWYAVDACPTPEGLMVFMRDVSGQRQAAEELRISNERFRRLYEANLIGIVFWNSTTGVTDGNDEYFRLIGFTRKQFRERGGIRLGELTPPEYKEKERKIIEGTLANGTSSLYEKEYVHPDGTRVPVVIGLAMVGNDRHDGVSFALDITDRKMAARRFRQLADHAPVLIWISGTDSGYHFFNKPWLAFTGRTMEQEAGVGWAEGVHPEDLHRRMAIYLASFEARVKFRLEYRLRRNDGRWRWILDDGQPMYSISGEFEGFIGSCVDITDRRDSEERLRHANTALRRSNEDLGQFAYAASHDLQEPLRMVRLYSQLLAKKYKGKLDAEADEFIDFITSGATRMHTLIDDLLAFTQVVEGPAEIDAPVNAAEVLESTLASMRIARECATVTFGELPMVAVHAQHLGQLYQNLIGNAMKYKSGSSVAIHISARREGAWHVFSVKDDGMGIDPQFHHRIFGIFKRLHGQEYPGTGIGLAICSRIVERHGGRIWVDSKFGAGAEFLFTLPAGSGVEEDAAPLAAGF